MDFSSLPVEYVFDFGWPQIVLLTIIALGVWLLVSALVGRSRATVNASRGSLRPRVKWGRGLSGLLVISLGVAVISAGAILQTYLNLTHETKAAHVIASTIEEHPHQMHLDLTLFDEQGAATSRKTYEFGGDRWALQADIVELQQWVSVIGVRSGYHVTRLFGQFDDGSHSGESDIIITRDQEFFASMRERSWWSKPFVRSAYGNVVVAAPGEYDVFVSRDAIKAIPARQ